jgi:hypothetical protein
VPVGVLSNVPFPRQSPQTLADDGDSLRFCSTCAFSQACMDEGMDKGALMDLHVLVEHIGPFHAGDHLFREGEPFEAIAAVRAGTVKTYVDRDGHEHVGFHLPGEVIGSTHRRRPLSLRRGGAGHGQAVPVLVPEDLGAGVACPACNANCSACSAATSVALRCSPATGRPINAWRRSSSACRGAWPRAGFRPAASS